MRIAQIAPLAEAVPPKLYGGTERVVSWLTEALVARGHEVSLFASGDSTTSAQLIACAPQGLRLSGVRDHIASHLVMLDNVLRRIDDFDIVHFHVDLLQYPVFRAHAARCLTTLHGRLDLPDYHPVYEHFSEMPLVSISNAQRKPMPPNVNWLATIHHGMPDPKMYSADGGDYLLFLGRICPEKSPTRAIEIAKRAGVTLKIAAKVDPADQQYFDTIVKPLLDHPLIEFIGEVGDQGKFELLAGARALLFPIDWPEPFGLVMIESMSVGTPVLAWRNGSVPEIIKDGVTGVIVDNMDAAILAVESIKKLSRAGVRRHFENNFTVSHMAARYEAAYEALLGANAELIPIAAE
jgi:glycosyltransferase involved in cell wall biosynthesis